VGKTRLVAAVADVYFVDHDAEIGKLADDLRWIRPRRIAVDDAGQHLELLRQLGTLRQRESDLLDYQIIAICWPDEPDVVRDVLRSAEELDVDLLERRDVDEIVRAMGVTSTIARQQILDQAEGRPGWAMALVDILTKTRKWESIFDGKVLLGEVSRYLRRASVSGEALDILTAVAALGGIGDGQIGKVAGTLGLSLGHVRQLLLSVARSGLVDVIQVPTESGVARIYNIRPPLLAQVLVAEHAFRSAVPTVNLTDLVAAWPEKLPRLAMSAISAAQLGVAGAVATATQMLEALFESNQGDSHQRRDLIQAYAQISQETGRRVLGWITDEFRSMKAEDVTGYRVEPLVVVASQLVLRYSFVGGVRILLDAASIDDRPTNSHPSHPLRQLEDLVKQVHPELAPNEDMRRIVASELEVWIAERLEEQRAWMVYGSVLSAVLSFGRRGSFSDPADWTVLNIVDGVLMPEEMQFVYDELWPVVRERLRLAPPSAIKAAIEVASAWLRIGSGFDQPFGQNHPQDSIVKAAELGRTLIEDLRGLCSGHMGLEAALRGTGTWHELEVALEPNPVRDAFFFDMERKGDRRAAMAQQQAVVSELVGPWADEEATVVAARLAEIKRHAEVAGHGWPNRLAWACTALKDHIDAERLESWVAASLNQGIFPEATSFLEAALSQGISLPVSLIEACLANPNARWATATALLTIDATPQDLVEACLRNLQPADYRLFESLFFGDELSVERRRALLNLEDAALRGVAAMAMFDAGQHDNDWFPVELETEWLDALSWFEPIDVPSVGEHDLRALVGYMASRYPDQLFGLIERHFDRVLNEQRDRLSYDLFSSLYLLPGELKTRILERFGQSELRWIFVRKLAGNDVEWLQEVLDADLLSAEEVLECRNGHGGPEPTIPELAKLLVPRGLAPEMVAYRAQLGFGWGSEADRLRGLIRQFKDFADSEDPSVAAVGKAGLGAFSVELEAAEAKEKLRRIRGR
jgi:hypothetical protein